MARVFSAEACANISKAQTGKKLSAETKEKIGAYWRGRERPSQRKDFCKRGHDMSEPGARHEAGHCVACRSVTNAALRATPKAKAKMKKYQSQYSRKRLYGITELDYARMFVSQNGVCAICKEADSSGKQLAVDHDHSTGSIRALLCQGCNLTLGKVKDSVSLLQAMIEYLQEHGSMSVVIN